MARSDSDVTENASLTSDDERIGPSSPVDGVAPQLPLPTRPTFQSNVSTSPMQPSRPPFTTGTSSRLKQSALRVIQMQKHSSKFMTSGIGAEPGIDPRKESTAARYSNIQENCAIQVIDYGERRASFRKMSNKGFIEYMDSDLSARQSWAKVRWINIGGLSWDVMSTLTLKYHLHPLSVEDVFHARQTSQSKADYYTNHLFISALCHTLRPDRKKHEETAADDPHSTYLQQRTSSPIPTNDRLPRPVTSPRDAESKQNWLHRRFSRKQTGKFGDDKEDDADDEESDDDGIDWIRESIDDDEGERGRQQHQNGNTPADQRKSTLERMKAVTDRLTPDGKAQAANLALVDELKKGQRVDVKIRNLYLFLLRDGTLISIYRDDTPTIFGKPLVKRLHQEQTLLRTSADASLLLQGLLDYVVDSGMEIVDRYHEKILRLEREILIKPKMKTVRELHILSGDLVLHKRTLTPVKSLVYGLRRYDLDRCIALVGSSAPEKDKDKVVGFMSHQSKVYLADVYDHMEYILTSLDMFASIAENLIGFTFNTISYQTNETMRRLSLATILFFPLTFLTGYFGMNFVRFNGVQHHSDAYFWKIAIPVMVVTILIFMWNDLERMGLFLQKKLLRRRIKQNHKLQ